MTSSSVAVLKLDDTEMDDRSSLDRGLNRAMWVLSISELCLDDKVSTSNVDACVSGADERRMIGAATVWNVLYYFDQLFVSRRARPKKSSVL
jgi:hypothetical protein